MNDKETREAIINQEGNIVISASAGSGKTSIMVKRIENDLKSNKKHYTIAATTFTNKAAKEIQDRLKSIKLGGIANKCFIGTNDSFAMEEIVKPFLNDAFGIENEIESDYNEKIFTYEEGINLIKERAKVGVYRDNKRNFKFELALKTLENSLASRRYLKSKYFKIFIDEYQDCDIDMHNLYIYISKSLGIDLFVVGDVKQSIYTWRGANPAFLNQLNKDNQFEKFKLYINFRSTKEIQNYTNLFLDEEIDMYNDLEESSSIVFIDVNYSKDLFNILNYNKTISFIVKTNDEAKKICRILNSLEKSPRDFVYIPKTPLSKISSSSAWIGEIVAKLVFNKAYNEYRLKNDIPIELDIKYLKDLVKKIKNAKNIENIIEVTQNLYNSLNYELNIIEEKAIIETIIDEQYSIAYEDIIYNHIVTTIHSSKGLEYDEVIIMAQHYNLNREEDRNNHYVAITRAKEKLVIFYNKNNLTSNEYVNSVQTRIKNKGINEVDIEKYMTEYVRE